jgi:hypothetical protein
MASFDLDPSSGNHHIRFRYGGKPFKRTLRLEDAREAERVCGVVEETLKDLKRGRLTLPEGADPGAFFISGGTVMARACYELHSNSGAAFWSISRLNAT